jgi:hypothetical protein
MSNRNTCSNDQDRSRPSFSGYSMPMNIDPTVGISDGVGDEVTRRVGVFQPSFESISSFQPPMMAVADSHIDAIQSKRNVTSRPSIDAVANSSDGIWQIKRVPSLPDFYPLERTSVFVPNVIDPSNVTMRISDVLRDRSIDAIFDNDKAKAQCTTMEGVEFRVRLYSGRGEYSHGVVVEVQRRFGTSNSFHNDTVAILNAAEGKELQQNVAQTPYLGSSNLPLLEDYAGSPVEINASSLAMISKMLKHKERDAHFLALQTLMSMTDSGKIGRNTARSVAEELFVLDSDCVATKILSLILDKQDDDDIFKLRTMALAVVANAFESVDGRFPKILKDQLRRTLLHELRSAKENTRNAVHAARILYFYVPQDNGTDVHSALEVAHEIGTQRNALLEHHVQMCLEKFD